MAVSFRECTLEDLEILQAFSRQRYFETFADMNTPENMTAYLDEAFATEKIWAELSDENSAFYFLYWDGKLAGYLKLNEFPAQTDIHDEQSLEIERIYVSKEFQGEGLGRYLVDQAISTAIQQKKKYVWLGVWEKNEKALRFYKRNGFYQIGTHSFVMGDDEQTDYIYHAEGFGGMKEYFIPACSGKSMDIAEGQTISVIDVEGGQVADFLLNGTEIPMNFCPQPLRLTATNR